MFPSFFKIDVEPPAVTAPQVLQHALILLTTDVSCSQHFEAPLCSVADLLLVLLKHCLERCNVSLLVSLDSLRNGLATCVNDRASRIRHRTTNCYRELDVKGYRRAPAPRKQGQTDAVYFGQPLAKTRKEPRVGVVCKRCARVVHLELHNGSRAAQRDGTLTRRRIVKCVDRHE